LKEHLLVGKFEHNLPLAAREVYQVLKDVSIGTCTMRRACRRSWSEIYHGLMPSEIMDGGLRFSTIATAWNTARIARHLNVVSGRLKSGSVMTLFLSSF
jgi:hypothetical protein